MKVIDAIWEKTNLGVNTVEIEIDEGDALDDIRDTLNKVAADYVVVKSPSKDSAKNQLIQEMGYRFAESIFSVEGRLKDLGVPQIYQRFIEKVEFKTADSDMAELVLNEIKTGDIFETDRIAMDSRFSKVIAGNRYYNWSKTEMEKGAVLTVAYYCDKPVAFGISKSISDTRYDNFLGGTLLEGKMKGLGFLAIAANHFAAQDAGAKIVETKLSSNNLPILRLHMQYGYDIKKINYIYVKHNK